MAEQELRADGIDAQQTRASGTAASRPSSTIDGHDEMKFYDPDSYREIPTN